MIMGITFVVNLIIGYFIGQDEPYYTGALCSIFIMVGVTGVMIAAQTFPFAIGFSIRRLDFFLGTAAFAVLVSVAFAAALDILTYVEQQSNGWGVRMHYFHLPWLSDGWAISRFWVFLVGFLHLFFVGFVYASVYRRFGRLGVLSLSAVLFVAGSFGTFLLTYYDQWGALLDFFKPLTSVELFSWAAIPIPLYAAISYGLLRKSVA
ncbi:hypothetical protein [Cohnella zeiphila]|uniref:Uncharacterized protein n=1 Tax=Cohnella zeiphila TaxID=2761120 RepID=A0A7X0VT98_9BACL|nr:hypothetical protein [Cohnella zeiphila]MBB6729639.1 hypothetical protein [Cohnella zeiphila]